MSRLGTRARPRVHVLWLAGLALACGAGVSLLSQVPAHAAFCDFTGRCYAIVKLAPVPSGAQGAALIVNARQLQSSSSCTSGQRGQQRQLLGRAGAPERL